MPVYSQFNYKPKAQVTRGDIGKGQIYLEHLSPALFLELQGLKTHQHTGVDSTVLPSDATPFMVRGFKLRERIERATVIWAGAASPAGALNITFGTKFNEIPTVVASPSGDAVDIQAVVGNVSVAGFTLSWKDDTGASWTSVPLNWIAIGI